MFLYEKTYAGTGNPSNFSCIAYCNPVKIGLSFTTIRREPVKLLVIVSLTVGVFVGEARATSFMNIANGLWSTGLNSSANPLTGGSTDPHYTLIAIPTGCTASDPTCIEGINDLFG